MAEDGLASLKRDPIKSSLSTAATQKRRQNAVAVSKERRESLVRAKRMCRAGPSSDDDLDSEMMVDEEEESILNSQASAAVEELKSAVAFQGKGAMQKVVTALRELRRILSRSELPPIEAALEAGAIPPLVHCLAFGSPDEQLLESAWCLTNIAAGKPDETKALVPALPSLTGPPTKHQSHYKHSSILLRTHFSLSSSSSSQETATMKVAAVAILGFITTGVLAGGAPPDKYCRKIVYDPPKCPHYSRDVFDLDERDEEFDERDEALEERDELEERDGLDERGDYYPPPSCNKKCPKYNLKCTKYGWKKGYPTYSGSFSETVDCKHGKDYTVTGSITSCNKYSSAQCLVVNYDGKYWPQDHDTSYLGVYTSEKGGPKKVKDLNYSTYCKGNSCSVPVEKLPGYPKLCDDDLWVAVDGGRCKNPRYGQYGYGKGKQYSPKDVITYVKLHVECKGKKECKAYCCDI